MLFLYSVTDPRPQQPVLQLLPAERDQRVEVAHAADRAVRGGCPHRDDKSCGKAPGIKERREQQKQYPEEFDRVAEFVAGLRVVGDRHEGRIQHNFRIEPAGFYGEIAEYQRSDDTERRREHVWRIDGCQAQAIHCQLQDQHLNHDRNIDLLCRFNELHTFRNPLRVLHQEHIKREEQQCDQADQDAGKTQVRSG